MFEGSNERFGIEWLISTGGPQCRTSIGDGTIGEGFDKFLDDKISTGEILECETGALGIDGAGRGVRRVQGRIVRHFGG